MNKIITNSKFFLKQLKATIKHPFESLTIYASKKDASIKFGLIRIDCECQNDFQVPFYKKSMKNLISHLELIEEQPITLQFDDSELFNVKICEMTV